ncbi:hypothetical protein ACI796_06565 [Geodermatophilus sp. SYSU D00525]
MATSTPHRGTTGRAATARAPGERRPPGRRAATVVAGAAAGGLLAWGVVAVVSGSGDGALEVPAQANVFGAGLDDPPAPGGGGDGVLPTLFRLPEGEGRVVTFPEVDGSVTPIVGTADRVGPGGDGGRYGTTDVESYGGISGIVAGDNGMFVTGVFLTDDPPQGEAPPRLDVTGVDTADPVAPEIGQTFLVGDGRDLRVTAPDEATRLFLGFADGYYYQGPPGWYDNNEGSVSVAVEVVPG